MPVHSINLYIWQGEGMPTPEDNVPQSVIDGINSGSIIKYPAELTSDETQKYSFVYTGPRNRVDENQVVIQYEDFNSEDEFEYTLNLQSANFEFRWINAHKADNSTEKDIWGNADLLRENSFQTNSVGMVLDKPPGLVGADEVVIVFDVWVKDLALQGASRINCDPRIVIRR